MPPTLELTDGTTTLDLLVAPYFAAQPLHLGPPPATPVLAGQTLRGIHYSPRTIEIALNLRAVNGSELRNAVRDLEAICATSANRLSLAHGAPVALRCQLGDADSEDRTFRVLMAEVVLPPDLLQEPALSTSHAVPGVRLVLLVEPFGRLAHASGSATIHNEQDGTAVNYVDFVDALGTNGARLQLKISDPGGWAGPARMWIARRSGPRRADTLFFQAEDGATSVKDSPFVNGVISSAVADVSDADASGGGNNVARIRWATRTYNHEVVTGLTHVGSVRVTVAGSNVPDGLFRVLARVRVAGDPFWRPFVPDRYDTVSAMGFALGWSFGGREASPADGDEVYLEETSRFQTIDLGEIALPPVALPEGYAYPDLTVEVHCTFKPPGPFSDQVNNRTYYTQWDIDYLVLLPIDEGAVIVDSVDSDDRVLMDTLSDTPGVYLLDANDVAQRFASFAGGAFGLGVEDTRIYVVRDEPGDPSTVRFSVAAVYEPLVSGV